MLSVKKTVALVICFTLLLGIFSISTYAGETVAGDVNGSGSLSVRDALETLKIASGLKIADEALVAIADVDGNGKVEAADALLMLKKIVQLIHFFPTETIEASGVVYIAGDSIASEHDFDDTYQRQVVGWGVVIGDLFTDAVDIHNEARSGRSSMSYITSSNYPIYINNLEEGDYYLISFGHNDSKSSDITRYTSSTDPTTKKGSFKWYLKTYYIDPAVRAGAFPVLLSPVVRCNFTNNILDSQSHESYALAMEELVEECRKDGINVGYIDLQQTTKDYYNEIGREEAESLHAYTATELDNTHYCEKGAILISQMIVEEMQRQKFNIIKYMK